MVRYIKGRTGKEPYPNVPGQPPIMCVFIDGVDQGPRNSYERALLGFLIEVHFTQLIYLFGGWEGGLVTTFFCCI